jgi:hypothetical protein
MKKVIEIIECRTADELLDALHPTRGTWPENSGGWLYRGHGDSRWELLPSAFRASSWRNGFTIPEVDAASRDDVAFWEQMLLYRFYGAMDRAGLQIPRGDELIRLMPTRFGSDSPWPDPVLEPLMALAQHVGIPTRLLDWTRKRRVAAYFAAIDALENKSKSLDVWALSQHFIELFGDQPEDLTCHIVRPLRHGNPNLHAQGGVFTLCRGDVRDEAGKFYPLDVFMTVLARGLSVPDDLLPCLRRFRLPTSEARALLLDLHNDETDAVALFPGYVGVVRSLREDHWIGPLLGGQWPQNPGYSVKATDRTKKVSKRAAARKPSKRARR